ncbi:hypothetical protein FACS1894184_03060 [Clostridia bacterium]|nr:hypothetical protein FACS1894184_03060 [Clostridia bacterium]
MTAKEYLNQGYRLNQHINAKIDLKHSLRDMACKATGTLSNQPRSATPELQQMASTVDKIIDLEAVICYEIDNLVELKKEIISVIREVDDMDQQTLLELRYLCFKQWEQIAVDLGYSIRRTFDLHDKALAGIVMRDSLRSWKC